MKASFFLDSQDFLRIAHFFSKESGTFLLYSGGKGDASQRSFLFLFPYDTLSVREQSNAWDVLKDKLGSFSSYEDTPEWVGYLGYELGASVYKKSSVPLAYFQRSKVTLVLDHTTNFVTVIASDEIYLQESYWKRCSKPVTSPMQVKLSSPIETLQSYIQRIEKAKEYLLDGDIYQVNLSHTIQMEGEGDPFDLFLKLNEDNPAPFSAYFQIPECTCICSSPERFLKKSGDSIEARPIKGTAPRGKTEEEDQANKRELLNSIKERSELLMITDLMRNDLGKISLPGSVNTTEMFRQEAYTNVFHLVSIISAKMQQMHPLDAIHSAFPGGSVTGCPKLRSLEVIHELEEGARGIYTGCIGTLLANGDFDFNIAIRTLVIQDKKLELRLGGGIVLDSDPKREYEETLHKGASFFKILGLKL